MYRSDMIMDWRGVFIPSHSELLLSFVGTAVTDCCPEPVPYGIWCEWSLNQDFSCLSLTEDPHVTFWNSR